MSTSHTMHVWSVVIIALSYASIAFFFQYSGMLTFILTAAVVILLMVRKDVTDVKVGLAILVLSAFFEVASVHIGLWHYPQADYFGVPIWLPVGWVLFVFLVRSLYALFSTTRSQSV